VRGWSYASAGKTPVAMAAIGLNTHLREIVAVGFKPIVLMLVATVFLAALCLAYLKGWP
jgi:uncharacterized membrane protein YadS